MGECSICLEGTCPPLLKLYCGHSFHKHCISRWFKTHNTCPVCRQLIVNKFIATNKDQFENDNLVITGKLKK